MEFLLIHFPVAEIETFVFIPLVLAFLISFFTSMAGISGAFLLLPLQVSLLGFTSLSVNSTNFLYNVVGTPGGVLGYAREKRLVWPLAATLITGTVPGVLVGYFLRVKLLPDPRTLKLFVGIVLLHVGYRLAKNIFQDKGQVKSVSKSHYQTCNISATIRTVRFTFRGEEICFSVPSVFFPALCVGIISGIYGIGGSAILAPFLVTIIRLPVYAAAEAGADGEFRHD